MSYATIMVALNADRDIKQLTGVAAGLWEKFSAKLLGISALMIPPPPAVAGGYELPVSMSDIDIAQIEVRLEHTEKMFRAGILPAQANEWRSAMGFPTDNLLREARCADLIMMQASSPWESIYREINVGASILGAGRPVLVVPSGAKPIRATHVVLGWKDTREARRAVVDALPFLHEAERVTVLEICEKDLGAVGLNDVIKYLASHRIRAEGRTETRTSGSGADKLISFAQDQDADLLVTGAYGHSRLNEWIFGGVTLDLLESSPLCCLMSH
jgi:nucleotide-binding universal stress UspA family protein